MIASFLSNISAKYYENPTMLSRVIAKNVGDVFFEAQCSSGSGSNGSSSGSSSSSSCCNCLVVVVIAVVVVVVV